jgi:beta-mannanase
MLILVNKISCDAKARLPIFSMMVVSLCLFFSYSSSFARTFDFNIDGCYTGAFVSWKTFDDGHPYEMTDKDLKYYQDMTGKKAAIIGWYKAFSYNGSLYPFPRDMYDRVTKNGSILMLSWEPRDWDHNSPYYFEKSLLPEILAGKYDAYIDSWAADIKALETPIIIRFAQEMNISNLSWSGENNGGGSRSKFGDKGITDGPKTFILTHRYIHDRFKKAGVTNVVWAWTPINWGLPFEPWNHYSNYYPGNEYVDIIALDEYNWGSSQSWSKWSSFNDLYWKFYSEITRLYPDKPIIIGEFSCSQLGGDKAAWIKETFRDIREKYPKIKGFCWFNTDNRSEEVNNLVENCDWRVDSSPGSADAMKEALKDSYFMENIVFK